MKGLWVIEDIGSFAKSLAKELDKRGVPYLWAKRDTFGFIFKTNCFKRTTRTNRITNYYGSLELRNLLKASEEECVTGDLSVFDYANTSSKHGSPYMLNSKYVLLPFSCFVDNLYCIAGIFSEDAKIFLRPNSSEKSFTGRLFDIEEFREEIKDFECLKGNSLIVVSSPKEIKGEWRFACKRNKIIDYSLYRFDNLITEVNSAPLDMISFVEDRIKETSFDFHTLDIAMLPNNKYKIIEANGCFTANLYGCNAGKFLDAIN